MKTVKILGAGCAKCKQTEAIVKEAIEKFDVEADEVARGEDGFFQKVETGEAAKIFFQKLGAPTEKE